MAALGINQVELERRSDITDTTWAAWRAGTLPGMRVLFPIIATTLGIPLADLIAVLAADRAHRPKPARRAPIRIDTPAQAQAWIDKQDPTTSTAGEGG